jgi:hypothetical protein
MGTVTIPTVGLIFVVCLVTLGIAYAGALRAGFGEAHKTFLFCVMLATVALIGTGVSGLALLVG